MNLIKYSVSNSLINFVHRKNNFSEESKNMTIDTNLKIIWLDQNN